MKWTRVGVDRFKLQSLRLECEGLLPPKRGPFLSGVRFLEIFAEFQEIAAGFGVFHEMSRKFVKFREMFIKMCLQNDEFDVK